MSFRARLVTLLLLAVVAGALMFFFPQIDMNATAAFYDGFDFDWRESQTAEFLHNLVHPVSVALAIGFAVMMFYHLWRKTGWRRWLFLLLTLMIGPGLIVNTGLKDNWGRARPVHLVEFGHWGKQYTPPLVMANQCFSNCSFVAGDPAFGFWFHSFAYVAPRRRRKLFWGGMAVGVGYGVLRIGMGAHFLSDVFFAGVVITLTSAALYALLFGRKALAQAWREWLTGTRVKPSEFSAPAPSGHSRSPAS